MYVGKIINSLDVSDKIWFHNKGSEIYIITWNDSEEMYQTHNYINEECAYGLIPSKNVAIITEFEYDENENYRRNEV